MTPEQREALHIARYALDRVINVHLVDECLPESLYKAVCTCIDEVDEALPVGDLGEKPITFILGKLREAKKRALAVHGYSAADAIDEARAALVLANEEGRL